MTIARRSGLPDVAARLVDEALVLLERDGILGGINLREIAERAEVNRANIYHYFGSRRELLRAAITSRFDMGSERVSQQLRALPFVERKLRYFAFPGGEVDARLRALLVIDGDDETEPMPLFEASISDLRRDVIDGHIDRTHDLVALQVAISSVTRGYRIFREAYARQVDTRPEELDERVAEILRQWLSSMSAPPEAR